MNDILFAANDIDFLLETKQMSYNFDIKDFGGTHYILRIEIFCNRSKRVLKLSKKAYIDHTLKMFNLQSCIPRKALISKLTNFLCLNIQIMI